MNPNNIMNNHLHTYFDRTQVGRRDFFRQLIFLTFVPLSILLFSLHLLGSYGLNVQPALLCSVCYVIGSVVSLVLYLLKGPKKLRYIMPVSVIFSMLVQGVRLLVLASMGQHDSMLTTLNITICYLIVLVSSISMFPRTSLVCTCIHVVIMFLCRYLTHNPMYGQLLIIYGFLSVATTIFGFVASNLLREQQTELHGYASTIDQILHVFNMRKSELMALLKLARSKDSVAVYDKEVMGQLEEKTLRNIIKVAKQIECVYANQRKDMHERYPMLTSTELDICRLVEQGYTISEISNILGKTASNVSTVRGNIRKKLGLGQDEDLRNALMNL